MAEITQLVSGRPGIRPRARPHPPRPCLRVTGGPLCPVPHSCPLKTCSSGSAREGVGVCAQRGVLAQGKGPVGGCRSLSGARPASP